MDGLAHSGASEGMRCSVFLSLTRRGVLDTSGEPSKDVAEHGFPEAGEKWTGLAHCPFPRRGTCQPFQPLGERKDPLKIGPRKNTVGLYSLHYKKDDLEDC